MVKKKEYLILSICIVGMLLRLHFGFDPTDEAYYYATAKRFFQGDIPFVSDWYPTQFFAVLLLPFYYFFSLFVPTGEGIILVGRYVYFAIQIMISFYSLWSFRREKYNLAVAILYMMCSRQNIPGLSYYNIYLSFCFVACLSIYNYYKNKKMIIYWVLAGISISIATLCMPYLAVGGALYVIYMLCKKHTHEALAFVLSIAFCATVYIAFLLSRASVEDYAVGLQYVLSNPDYSEHHLWEKIWQTGLSLGKVNLIAAPTVAFLIYRLFAQIVQKDKYVSFDKKDELAFMGTLILCVAVFGIWKNGSIYQQFTFLVFPYLLKAFVNRDYKKNDYVRIGIIMYLAGIVVAFFFWVGSDTGASCLPLGLLISVVGGVIVLSCEKATKFYLIITLLLMISATSSRLFGQCYRDGWLLSLDTHIDCGPAKGLYTENDDADDYYRVIKSLDYISDVCSLPDESKQRILFTAFLPWGYLYSDYRNAAMTCWRTPLASDRLNLYYQVNPDQFPDVIFVLDEDVSETNGLSGGERMNASNPKEGKVWERISLYKHFDTDAGEVFVIGN